MGGTRGGGGLEAGGVVGGGSRASAAFDPDIVDVAMAASAERVVQAHVVKHSLSWPSFPSPPPTTRWSVSLSKRFCRMFLGFFGDFRSCLAASQKLGNFRTMYTKPF